MASTGSLARLGRSVAGWALFLLPFLVFASIHPAPASAQTLPPNVTVVGRITNQEDEAVPGVVVRIESSRIQGITDQDGFYRLERVPPGPQVLATEHIGYAPARVSVTVPASGEVRQDIRLAFRALEVEGITVTADPVSRARGESATATVIAEDAIRHQTAPSLAGVLELLPGVEMSPPGLGSIQQIPLRAVPTSGGGGSTSAADLASFGTLIIVDGVPLSNNANLQSLGPRGELGFSSTAGAGIDLRQIPAATLERVEVINGIPSARYGDLTQGAIVVDTRAGAFEPEVRTQLDPNTFETTAIGGWNVGSGQSVTLNMDYARTRSMPGITKDYSNRVAGQVAHRFVGRDGPGGAARGSLMFDSRIDYYRVDEDLPENQNTRPGTSSQYQDTGLRFSERVRIALSEKTTLTATGAVTRQWQRSWATAGVTRAAMPFTDRLTPGRSEGWFVGGLYVSELRVDGDPWNLFARAEVEGERGWLGFHHRFRSGIEMRREWNSGAGYQFDMEFPPQVSFNGVQGFDRPRSFEPIPALATSAAYFDDRITGAFGKDVGFSLQVGIRAEGLHEDGGWLPAERDLLVQPRLWAEVSPREWIRFRGGWGISSKAPSLGDLYPAQQYNDVVNVNWYANQPDERLAVLTTHIFDPTNQDLGLSKSIKLEGGVELQRWGSVLAVTAFKNRIEGGVGFLQNPESLLREHFQLTDSLNGNGIRPQIIEPASGADTVPVLVQRPTNFLNLETSGVEFSATLAELPKIRTRIQVQGSWLRTERRFSEPYFGRADRFSDFQLLPHIRRAPYWDGVREVAEKNLVTYRLIHHQPDLGFVMTATIQHNLKDFRNDPASRDTLSFSGYITRDGELVSIPASERSSPDYQDLRVARGGLLDPQSTASDWMMAVQVSKTLPLEGEFRFWAFNALDRVGQYGGGGKVSRLYPRFRFGVELRMAPRVVMGGG